MKKIRLLALALALGLGLVTAVLSVSGRGLAQDDGLAVAPSGETRLRAMRWASTTTSGPSLRSASDVGIASVTSSTVETEHCYQDGTSQVLCFTVYNASTDGEWLDRVRLTFPTLEGAWNVTCHSQDATDSIGYAVSFNCDGASITQQVVYSTTDSDGFGEISNGASWSFCVDADIPSGYDGDRIINWGLDGDEGNDITGQTTIEHCTPLWFKTTSRAVEGCNGLTQTHTFELWNVSAGSGTVNLTYDTSPEGSVFTGPASFDLSNGGVVTFTTQFKPDLCLKDGQKVTATLTASGNGESDASTIVNTTITDLAGWQGRTSSISPTMDNVVVWASFDDGGLWSIGGYGSDGATQRYDPNADTWQTFEPETVITPPIEYPVDGCYGRNGDGDEVVILFPDTLVTDTLHMFNITTRQWSTRPIPDFFPGDYIGHWGFDVVSLLNNPAVKSGIADKNMCYLSGGNHQKPGGGTTRNLWRYDPETNGGEWLGNFADTDVVFGFHASWYVPWVGDDGAICVGGGADHNHIIHTKTQCYDLAAENFNDADDDLGPLPEPWWGMADGWQVQDGEYQIWIASGVAQDGTLLPASAYASATSGGFVQGPEVPVGLYRLEGTGFNGQFFTLGGSQGGFWYSKHTLRLVQCPTCYQNYLPAVLRSHQ